MFSQCFPLSHCCSYEVSAVRCQYAEKTTLHLQIALSSDEAVFGGWENVSKKYDVDYQTQEVNI